MIRVAAALLLVLTVGSTAVAGQIYGALFQDNQPLGGAHLKLSCGNDVIEGDTGPDGVYRLFARFTGSCTLQAEANGRSAIGSLYSYDRPTAYDFDLVRQGSGWALVYRKR